MHHVLEETTFSFSTSAPQPDRRRTARHLTILRVGALIIDGRRELCLIRNISAGGLMAHVYSPIEHGQRLAVELKSDQTVAGSVIWVEDVNIGVSFDEPIDVEEMLAIQAVSANGWRPRLPRVEVDRLGTVRAGARTYAVSTCDISQGGVKLEIDQPLQPGEDVVFTPERFRPVQGVVRWFHGGTCGISFNQVIPFHDLMRWLRDDTDKVQSAAAANG
jgi:hypothetical protein